MTDTISEFLEDLGRRGKEPLLHRVRGKLRLEIADGKRTDRWLVAVDRGDVAVSHQGGAADCVVVGPKDLLDRLASGRANAMAALLRGELAIAGDFNMLVLFQRIFPGPRRSRLRRASGSPRRQR